MLDHVRQHSPRCLGLPGYLIVQTPQRLFIEGKYRKRLAIPAVHMRPRVVTGGDGQVLIARSIVVPFVDLVFREVYGVDVACGESCQLLTSTQHGTFSDLQQMSYPILDVAWHRTSKERVGDAGYRPEPTVLFIPLGLVVGYQYFH